MSVDIIETIYKKIKAENAKPAREVIVSENERRLEFMSKFDCPEFSNEPIEATVMLTLKKKP